MAFNHLRWPLTIYMQESSAYEPSFPVSHNSARVNYLLFPTCLFPSLPLYHVKKVYGVRLCSETQNSTFHSADSDPALRQDEAGMGRHQKCMLYCPMWRPILESQLSGGYGRRTAMSTRPSWAMRKPVSKKERKQRKKESTHKLLLWLLFLFAQWGIVSAVAVSDSEVIVHHCPACVGHKGKL